MSIFNNFNDFIINENGVECSEKYWTEIKPTFDFLDVEKGKGTYFRDLSSKEDQFYVPILNAFSITDAGIRIAFKNCELAEYAGQQFFDIYTDFLA